MLDSKQFSFHLARYAKVSEAEAEKFMSAVTQVLLQQIKSGEEVTIQGLGTFSVLETQQGRRLSFQVDDKMRAQVNAPFACFEPMTLSIKPEKPAEPQEPVAAETSEEPVAEAPAEEAAPVASAEETAQAAPVEEKTAETAPAETAAETAPQEPEKPQEKETEKAAPAPVEKPKEEEKKAEKPEGKEKPAEKAAPAPAEAQPKPRTTRRQPEPEWYEVYWAKTQAFLKPYLEQIEAKTKLKPWMVGAIAGGILVILLIIIFAVACGGSSDKKVDTKAATEAVADSTAVAGDSAAVVTDVQTETPATAADKSGKADKAKPAPAAPAAKVQPAKQAAQTAKRSSSSGSYVHSSPFTSADKPSSEILMQEGGQPKRVKLSEGERLTLLALNTYGDKAFWAYIYDVNAFQLGDPNNVPTNVSLYLPDPTYFKIDSSNPASIKRAQNRAMQILYDPQPSGPWGRR